MTSLFLLPSLSPENLGVWGALLGEVEHAGDHVVAAGGLSPAEHHAHVEGLVEDVGLPSRDQLDARPPVGAREESLDAVCSAHVSRGVCGCGGIVTTRNGTASHSERRQAGGVWACVACPRTSRPGAPGIRSGARSEGVRKDAEDYRAQPIAVHWRAVVWDSTSTTLLRRRLSGGEKAHFLHHPWQKLSRNTGSISSRQ